MVEITGPGASCSRRRFLAGAGLATAAVVAGGRAVWAGPARPPMPPGPASSPGPLVLVTLYGGNDGLNTVVPAGDPIYASARPTLGYRPEEVLALGAGFGLNPKLSSLHALWSTGQLAVVLGVGYPNPNLSHFDSMDIWQTANPTDGTGPGWLGRWLDATGTDPMRAISVGATLPVALRGQKQSATAITSRSLVLPGGPGLHLAYSALLAPGPDRPGLAGDVSAAGRHLLAAQSELERLGVTPPAGPGAASATTPRGTLAAQLGLVAELIRAGAPSRVYQVSLSSFDTHAGEKVAHERMLGELDVAVGGFFSALGDSSEGRGVVLMTYSEFGRRVAQNASGGTDHGTAGPVFVAGPGVKGGRFYGEQPSLGALDADGNLIHSVDFRSLYATLLGTVIGVDPSPFLGGRFPVLDLL